MVKLWGDELTELSAVARGEDVSPEAKSKKRNNRIRRHF